MHIRSSLAALACGAILTGTTPAAARRMPQPPPPAPADGRGVPPADALASLQLDGENLHHCGNVQLHIGNFGLVGALPGSRAPFDAKPSGTWPAGGRSEYVYGGGLWVGARLHGQNYVSTAYPETFFVGEFQPGREERDRAYLTHDGAANGTRLPNSNPDDDRDRRVDEDPLNGRDDDGDGSVDEDFAAASDEMLVCEYADIDPRIRFTYPDHVPLGLQIRQSSLCWGVPAVDDFIGFDYEIVNTGINYLDDVYVGFYADFDCGPRDRMSVAQDDRAGFWEGYVPLSEDRRSPRVKISMAYMFDADGDEGVTDGYVGLLFLGAEGPRHDGLPRRWGLHNMRVFAGRGQFEAGGDPTHDDERYRCLDGTASRSLPEAHPQTGVRPAQLSRNLDDYSVLISAGPFLDVRPGDTVRFRCALVVGRGFDGLLANAVQAQQVYEGFEYDCDGNFESGDSGNESSVCAPASGVWTTDPCDSICIVDPLVCQLRVPAQGCIWINDDCEEEKRLNRSTGENGNECKLPWFAAAAPPAPPMRVVATQHRVDVLWDDTSQRARDPVTNFPDFESYRVWRASGWTRPPGSDVHTGPGVESWQLLAEFDVARDGVGSDTGFESVRYQPVTIPADAIEFYRRWLALHPGQTPPDLPTLTSAQRDTAIALAQGRRYHRYVDPGFLREMILGAPCPADGGPCPLIPTERGLFPARCNASGRCQATAPPPHSGTHLFYAVTATDFAFACGPTGCRRTPGLANGPTANFAYVVPPTTALGPERFAQAEDEIYVVPNPVSRSSLQGWRLEPANDDPTGVKVEFHHLPRAVGQVTVFTLAGDRVVSLPFDGRSGNGTLVWNLLSRNGQEIASGVYLYVVEASDSRFHRVTGKFAVIQ